MSLNILHLSDLHLNNNTDVEELAAKIHNVLLDQHKLSLDIIIVTGDIFDAKCFSSENYESLIDKAIAFFGYLSLHFKISHYGEQLFFVPGNHEIYRESPEQLVRYRDFLTKIYADKWNDIAEKTYDKEKLCFVKHFIDKKVILIGLNSPRYEAPKKESEKEHIETARIGNTQINLIKKQIRMIDERDDCRVVVCLHNNIYNTLEYAAKENIDSTCVQDNDALLSMLSNYNCSLILHGHKHQQKNRRINLTQDIKGKDYLCTVIGGGKLADSFNYLEIYDTNSDIDLYCMKFRDETGSFILAEEFRVPIQESKRRFSKMIEEVLQSDQGLKINYEQLKDTDTNCDPKLIEMFDAILGSFEEISSTFFGSQGSDLNPLYIVLGAIHYRSNYDIKNGFLMQSEEFIKKATDKSGLSDMVIEILKIEDVWGLHGIYEKSKNNPLFGKHRKPLIFLALSIYLSEFFITIKKRPNKFFDDHIQQKANYNLGGDDIKPSINGNTIKFEVNEEHRALEISVRCVTANSHKVVSLIIKEFELVLSKFEEDFASVGFRVYYALPKLTKADIDDKEYESYEFGAFIPQLIPLLAGRNIYSEPEAFTRELIQNSIDAIKVREKSSEHKDMFSTDIELEIKEDDKSGLKYFKITDQGTGMNRYVLERYLTTIGRSFYTSSDFTELGIAYSPISKFGIGFLSCFMLGKQVRVYTTHHDDPNTTFYLDIPNYDGCFFIEIKKNEEKAVSGSSITVWENSELKGKEEKFDIKKIRSYIKNIICNIPFDITLNKRKFIPKFNYYNNLRNETKKYEILFFIPLMSDSVVSDMDANNKILIDNGIDRHSEHGIYFSKKDKSLYDIPNSIVMNNGILVSQSNLKTEARGIHSYLDIAFNFPSYALELEVSRDKLKFLNNFDPSNLRNLLKTIIRKYLKSDSAKKLEYIFWCLLDRSMFKLSEINISITGNILNVKIEEHSPIEELECFCKLMKRSKENMREKRTNIYPRLFRFIFDEYNFHGQIFTYFNKQKKRLMKNSEKFIRSFQDKIIGFCFDYEKPNMTVLRNYADFATRFSKNPDKFIPILLAESSYEYHRNISGNRLQEKESNAFTYTRAMLVMTTMKYLLSIICTHSKLSEGFSIHLEGISVNESSDDS